MECNTWHLSSGLCMFWNNDFSTLVIPLVEPVGIQTPQGLAATQTMASGNFTN